jgi:hypothetical protein
LRRRSGRLCFPRMEVGFMLCYCGKGQVV